MGFNLISQFLENGMQADEVLALFQKNSPKLAGKIKKLILGGLGSLEILSSLKNEPEVKNLHRKQLKPYDTEDIAKIGLLKEKMGGDISQEEQSRKQLLDFSKKVLQTGAQVAGSYFGGRLINAALSNMPNVSSLARSLLGEVQGAQQSPKLGQLPLPNTPPAAPQGIAPTPSPMNPIGPAAAQAPGPPNAPTGPNPRQGPAVNAPQPNIGVAAQAQGIPQKPDSVATLDMLGIREKLERLRAEGKPPQMIKGIAEKLISPEHRAELARMNQPGQPSYLSQVLDDFLSRAPTMEKTNLPPGQQNKLPDWLEGSETYEPKSTERSHVKPLDKGNEVLTPTGEIGEVVANNGKDLLVKENGKTKKYNADELEREPEEAIEAVQNILKIPEVDRSSIVSLFSYDTLDEEMFIQFHNGESYKYLDVPLQKVITIANKLGIPVTKGKNIFGGWSPEDKKSLGAALIKEIISDPKYKKSQKGEPENPNYRKLDTYYDYWEKLRKKPKKKK